MYCEVRRHQSDGDRPSLVLRRAGWEDQRARSSLAPQGDHREWDTPNRGTEPVAEIGRSDLHQRGEWDHLGSPGVLDRPRGLRVAGAVRKRHEWPPADDGRSEYR